MAQFVVRELVFRDDVQPLPSHGVVGSWLTDKDPADHQKIEAPKTVYVLSFDGDPTAAGVSLLQQAGWWEGERIL